MANILDYLRWRGDIDFYHAEFNEIDNIILSWIAYVDFNDIMLNKTKEKITIKMASDIYFSKNSLDDILEESYLFKTAYQVLYELAKTKRYKDVLLVDYVDKFDDEREVQFGAITFIISKKIKFVAFRGTDDSIIGWKEDFKMGAMKEVPAQKEATRYLNRISCFDFHKLYVGGHSKGGNLAVYSSVMCKHSVKKKIIKIYNNDGPGFRDEFVNSKEYLEIVDRVQTIIPQSSIIGMLLCHKEEIITIESSAKGIRQHDPMSWSILGDSFVRVDNINGFSRFVDSTLKNWYYKMSDDERIEFINLFFDILESTGAKRLGDFSDEKLKKVNMAIKALSETDKQKKDMITKVLSLIFCSGKEVANVANPIKKILKVQKDGDSNDKVN